MLLVRLLYRTLTGVLLKTRKQTNASGRKGKPICGVEGEWFCPSFKPSGSTRLAIARLFLKQPSYSRASILYLAKITGKTIRLRHRLSVCLSDRWRYIHIIVYAIKIAYTENGPEGSRYFYSLIMASSRERKSGILTECKICEI